MIRRERLAISLHQAFSSHLLSGTLTPQVFQAILPKDTSGTCSCIHPVGLGWGGCGRQFSRAQGDLRPEVISPCIQPEVKGLNREEPVEQGRGGE